MRASIKQRQAAREIFEVEMPDDTIIVFKAIMSLELGTGIDALQEILSSGLKYEEDPMDPTRKLSSLEKVLRSFLPENQWEAFYQSCWSKEHPIDVRELTALVIEIFNTKTEALDIPLSGDSASSISVMPIGGQSTPSAQNGASEELTPQISPIG
jgi:hypothetical protein